MKVDKEIYNTIKHYATEEPYFMSNIEPYREKVIEAIKEYRRQRDYLQEFLDRRKKYEDFLSKIEPIEPETTGNNCEPYEAC